MIDDFTVITLYTSILMIVFTQHESFRFHNAKVNDCSTQLTLLRVLHENHAVLHVISNTNESEN